MRERGRANDDVRDYHPALRAHGVTPREAEVARLVGFGYENEEVSEELVIAGPTAKAHVSALLHKLGVRRRKVLIGEIRRLVEAYREERARQLRAKRAGLRVVKRRGPPGPAAENRPARDG